MTTMSGPMRMLSATEATQDFTELLADVEKGEAVAITVRGRPVAKLVPFMDESEVARREEARRELLKHLSERPVMNLGRFNRDDAYDD